MNCSSDHIAVEEKEETADFVSFDIPGLTMHQSMAFYGGNAVFITPIETDLLCDIYDIETKRKKAQIILPHQGYQVPHANTSCFGSRVCSDSSVFPALYVSAWNGGRHLFIYEISLSGTTYEARLAQVIDPSHINGDYAGRGQLDWVIDEEHDMLYSLGYGLNSSRIYDGNSVFVCQYKLPTRQSEIVFLEDEDIVEHFVLPMMTVSQDKCYYNGHIFVVAGLPDGSNQYPPRLFDIDLNKQSLNEQFIPVEGEPEGFCIYNDIKWLNIYGSKTIINLDSLMAS